MAVSAKRGYWRRPIRWTFYRDTVYNEHLIQTMSLQVHDFEYDRQIRRDKNAIGLDTARQRCRQLERTRGKHNSPATQTHTHNTDDKEHSMNRQTSSHFLMLDSPAALRFRCRRHDVHINLSVNHAFILNNYSNQKWREEASANSRM